MTAAAGSLDAIVGGLRDVHDPTVVRADDGTWFMFSTDAASGGGPVPAGVHVRTSPDLVDWTFVGTALAGVPEEAAAYANAVGLWAPEVVRWPVGEPERAWRMYYSASSFGSRTSMIALATAAHPAGPWTDEGAVVATRHDRDAHNAIDAGIVFDRGGAPWMVYGSFFDGIRLVRLDLETGRPARPGDDGLVIARRDASVDGAVEGAYIEYVPEHDRFALYVSFDSLFDTYSMRVGMADEITGPYLDASGLPLLDPADAVRAGTKILGGHRFAGGPGWIAPGHNSVFRDGDRRFVVHHVRREVDPSAHEAHIRRVELTASGWPVVSPHPFAGASRELLPATQAVDGRWHAVRWEPAQTGVIVARPVRVRGALSSSGEAVRGPIVVESDSGDVTLEAVVFGGYDPVAARSTLVFGGLDDTGALWSGTREAAA